MVDKKHYQYILNSTNTSTVVQVKVGDEIYLVDPKLLIPNTHKLYTKNDAQYELFRKAMEGGKSLRNYRQSKYYKMYLERAKIENPEFLFND